MTRLQLIYTFLLNIPMAFLHSLLAYTLVTCLVPTHTAPALATGSSSRLAPMSPRCAPILLPLGHFLTFWHHKVGQAQLVLSVPQRRDQPLLQGVLLLLLDNGGSNHHLQLACVLPLGCHCFEETERGDTCRILTCTCISIIMDTGVSVRLHLHQAAHHFILILLTLVSRHGSFQPSLLACL